MTSQDKPGFVLCLVALVLLMAVIIAGYSQLKTKEVTYSGAARSGLTQLVKAVH